MMRFTLSYLSVDSSLAPLMISGVRASSIRIESTSSTMREVVSALHAVLEIELHVVAQVVEAELVVGAVGDVSCVGFAPFLIVQVVHDHADRQPEEACKACPSTPSRVWPGSR